MKDLKQNGSLSVTAEELQRIQKDFSGQFVSDEETKAVIAQVYNSYGYLLDPHTAVAMGAYMKELQAHPEDGGRHTVIAATAIRSSSRIRFAKPWKFRPAIRHMKALSTSVR